MFSLWFTKISKSFSTVLKSIQLFSIRVFAVLSLVKYLYLLLNVSCLLQTNLLIY